MTKHSKSKDESSDDSLYNSSEGEQINDQVNEEVEEEDEEELEAVARPVNSDEDDTVGSGDDREDDDNNNELWKEEWSYTLQRFKTHANIASFTWGKCTNCYNMHYESCFKPCGAFKEHSFIRN